VIGFLFLFSFPSHPIIENLGRDPCPLDIPRAMDDGLFEVTLQGGLLSLGLFQIGIDSGRPACQAAQLRIVASEPCFIQIDGEGKCVPADLQALGMPLLVQLL
jgi:hypothetical protein